MHPAQLTVHLVQHFPVVRPKLVLHPDRQVAATLLQHPAVDVIAVPGVVPLLKVIEQLARQPVTPGPHALLMLRERLAAPSSGWGWSPLLLPGQYPPDAMGAVIPVDEHSAWLRHIVRS